MDSSEPPSKRATAASPRSAASDSQERGGSRKAGSDKRLTSAPSPVRPTGGLLFAVGSGLAMGYYFALPKRLLQQASQPTPEFPAGAVVAIAALILIIAFLNLASMALYGVHKTRLRQLADEEGAAARAAQRILEAPERYQATTQIGITLAGMFAAALAATTLAEPLAYWLAQLASRTAPGLAGFALDLSLVLVILCVAFLEILFGEFMPRHLAVRYSDQFIARVGGPVTTLAALASPLVSALTWLTHLMMRPFGEPAESTAGYLTEEEIKNLVEESEKEGVLEEQETEMIHSVLEFTDIVVREVMVPRIDMVCVEAQRSIDALREVVLASGHTRIPVYEETVDNIIGTVHAKDLLRVVRSDADALSI
ncbi:MAG TPA: CNNM domain-containing protein, partial [Armatimonadota bacterium]|nr:CNNM domain-containing protein [Armatimonadota bacterium]